MENLPLVCNNIQDPDQEQRRQRRIDNNIQDQDPVLRNLNF